MPTVRDRLRDAAPSALAFLGIGGCALCCALPLLVGAGVLTGAGAAFLVDWLPGVAVTLMAAAAVAWWWASRRGRCSSCADGGDAGPQGAGCSCGATSPARP